MKSGMLWHLTQTVLLAADLEPMEDANESGSTEHQSWSGEIADWEHLSAEQFFPLEDGGFQDLILDVLEPQRAVNSGPFVLSKCDNYYSRQNHISTALYYCWWCSPSVAEAILNSLFTKRIGETRAGWDVERAGWWSDRLQVPGHPQLCWLQRRMEV